MTFKNRVTNSDAIRGFLSCHYNVPIFIFLCSSWIHSESAYISGSIWLQVWYCPGIYIVKYILFYYKLLSLYFFFILYIVSVLYCSSGNYVYMQVIITMKFLSGWQRVYYKTLYIPKEVWSWQGWEPLDFQMPLSTSKYLENLENKQTSSSLHTCNVLFNFKGNSCPLLKIGKV